MSSLPPVPFPADFLWGTASAAYQIEGAANADGRGESIWDRFCATPGKVRNGDTGAVACDFYHRYRDDIALLRDLGASAFRLSIAWPRVLPSGRGRVNKRGLDFYDRLVDALLEARIQPFVTFYHWDLPQALEDRGGWPNRTTVDAFCEYVAAVAARLGDRVQHWITQNEPWVASWAGYGWGHHAPGRTSEADALAAAHHLLLSHGRAVEILRSAAPTAQVGITLDLHPIYPASDDEADVAAARHVDGFHNRWFLDPVFKGSYPEDMLAHFGMNAPRVADGDLEAICAPIDFLGVNNYSRNLVRADPEGGPAISVREAGAQYTDMDWEVYPDGLHDLLVRVSDDYAPRALYITENGAAFPDVRGHEGTVRDPERRDYLEGHIDAVGRAVEAGAPVRGYFVWTLMDNFEWAWGYWKRFGLVFVDYPTLERVPKESYYWYRDFIAQQQSGRGAEAAAI
ncbi:MAG TPA: GH1 family beta-glucosidase [Gaiellaceae bacterium]|nr:GH1 family beta-glucosidase [Gaiellaceae bacterium]